MGLWASGYFVIYLALVAFVFGAATPSASALATTAMFPGLMPFWAWAVLHSVVFGFGICIIGKYKLFERVMEIFVGAMFVTVVGLALLLGPDIGNLALGTVLPLMPEGSLPFVLAVIGGVGGTFTLVSYTYWVRERGWRRPSWIPMMRLDLGVGYAMTGIFMVAMLVIGAELLFANGESIVDEAGLVTLSDTIKERFGPAGWLFLIGFWAAATSSIARAWNGDTYLFGDLVRSIRRVPEEEGEAYLSEKGILFRAFLVWITFPPMLLLILDEPVLVVIAYASLGTLFMPFLAGTLLWLLNRRVVTREYRNGLLANLKLGASVLLFIYVGIQEVLGVL
jgi:Mn2+/Fe2+ NRAMP family transporter